MSDQSKVPSAPPSMYPAIPAPVSDISVTFSDSRSYRVIEEFAKQHPKLLVPIVHRSSKHFEKYILPVSFGENLTGCSFDTPRELDECIQELKYYGIKLTDSQTWNIFQTSGLVDKFMKIRHWWLEHKKPKEQKLKSKYRKNFELFSVEWERFLNISSYSGRYALDRANPSTVFNLSSAVLINNLINDRIQILLYQNYLYDNVLEIYCDQFISYLIQGKEDCFALFHVQIGTASLFSLSEGTIGGSLLSAGAGMLAPPGFGMLAQVGTDMLVNGAVQMGQAGFGYAREYQRNPMQDGRMSRFA